MRLKVKLQVKLQLELKLELKIYLYFYLKLKMEMKMKMKMKVLPFTPHAIIDVFLQCFHLPPSPSPHPAILRATVTL